MNALPETPLLVVDASSPTTRCALWQQGRFLASRESALAPLTALPEAIEYCLSTANLSLESLAGYLYCEGPGSVLGLRLAAMMLRTWQATTTKLPIWAYRSLDFAYAWLTHTGIDTNDTGMVIEARQGKWARLRQFGGPIEVTTAEHLASMPGTCYRLPQRKSWLNHELPDNVATLTLDWHQAAPCFHHPGLLRPVTLPEILVPEPAIYQTWTPERHRK